ncbi:uncharacterized protein LOC107041163 [Diachasma alloeum]|uniref:uncharacterized protein LOC107041163 n=1 Tax=Diachasma alloeum TaxID=454923 RepID=UPI0010FB896E|nr:uncharacterized protein LOC107041163 [Diachasma alloeum]
MLERFLSPLVVLLGLVGTGESQYSGCDYAQRIEPGRSYPVFSPGYPANQNYRPGTFCRWTARSDRPIQIKCQPFIIPYQRPGCPVDVVLIQTNPRGAQRYCGEGRLDLVSEGNEVIIALQSARYSPGGRFLCVLQNVPDRTDSCRCGWKNPTRIVGGTTTGVNEYPMMAGLIDVNLKIVYCGATIINDRQVVTAAHCITANMTSANLAVLVGDHDLVKADETNATVLHKITGIAVHPRYNAGTQDNDIAIITTITLIQFNQQVGPACLPFQHRFDSFAGNYVDILGWGSIEFGEAQSKALQKAEVGVITPRDCRRTHPRINENHMCTLGQGKDSCQYDSGGPVLWRNPSTKRLVLAGLVSFGGACADGNPAVNTRIGGFIDFITSQKPPELLFLIFLRYSRATSNSPTQNCSYFQILGGGESYSVYNPYFPRKYEGENNCQWITRSDRVMDVNCSVNLPASVDCNQDSLIIQGLFVEARAYCGVDEVFLQAYGEVKINLITPESSDGGTFECDIKTYEDADYEGDEENDEEACHCGWKNSEKIVGGTDTEVNEYPMMAGLVDLSFREVYCGATIINNRQVITAASCLEDIDQRLLTVLVGEHDVVASSDTDATKIFKVDSIHIHPYYSGKYNDIAIITVSGTIEFNEQVGPVCLPFQHAPDSFAGQFVDVLGWGNLAFTGAKATTLQKIEVSVITNYECRKTSSIQEFQICTFTEGKDACQFDAGGPLLWRNHITKRLVLTGIISYSTGCAYGNNPGINTRIGAYIDWILSVSPADVKYCVEE